MMVMMVMMMVIYHNQFLKYPFLDSLVVKREFASVVFQAGVIAALFSSWAFGVIAAGGWWTEVPDWRTLRTDRRALTWLHRRKSSWFVTTFTAVSLSLGSSAPITAASAATSSKTSSTKITSCTYTHSDAMATMTKSWIHTIESTQCS